MRRFRRERIRAEPADTVGFRTIHAGDHEVILALRRSGGSVAVTILHPKDEKEEEKSD